MPAANNICGAGEVVISPLTELKVLYYSETFVPSSLNLTVFLAWKMKTFAKCISSLFVDALSDKVIEAKRFGFVFNRLELIPFFT